jgi:hypothetical protein
MAESTEPDYIGARLPPGTEVETLWLTKPDRLRVQIIADMLHRAQAQMDVPIGSGPAMPVEWIDAVLKVAAQCRKLDPELYRSLSALRQLLPTGE